MSTPEGQPVCWICQCGPGDVADEDVVTRDARTPSEAATPLLSSETHTQLASSPLTSGETRSAPEPLCEDRCLCVGVMSRVHLSCLNEWVLRRGHKNCSLCGATYHIISVLDADDGTIALAGAAQLAVPHGVWAAWNIHVRYALRWLKLVLLAVLAVARIVQLPFSCGLVLRAVYVDMALLPVMSRVYARFSPQDITNSTPVMLRPRLDADVRYTLNTREWLCREGSAHGDVICVLAPWIAAMAPAVLDRTSNAAHAGVALLQCLSTGTIATILCYALVFSWRHFSQQISVIDALRDAHNREVAAIINLPAPARRFARLSLVRRWWSLPQLAPPRLLHLVVGLSGVFGWFLTSVVVAVLWWVSCKPDQRVPPLVIEAVYMGPPAELDEVGQAIDATALLQEARGAQLGTAAAPRMPAPAGSAAAALHHMESAPLLGRRRRRALEHQRRARYGACRTVVVVRGAGYAFVQREVVRAVHVVLCPWLVGVCVQAVTSCAVDWSLPLWGGSPTVVWASSRLCAALPPLSRTACVALTPSLDVLSVCGHWLAGACVLWCATRLIVGPALGSVVAPRVMQDWMGLIQAHPLDVAGVDACVTAHWVRGNVRRERSGGGGARAWLLDTLVHVLPRELWRVWCRTAVCCVLLGVPSCVLWWGRALFARVVPVAAQYDSTQPLPLWTLGGRGGDLAAHTALLHNSSLLGTAQAFHSTFTQWAVARHGPHHALSLWGLLLTLASLSASAMLALLMIARRWLWSTVLLLEQNRLAWAVPTAPVNASTVTGAIDQYSADPMRTAVFASTSSSIAEASMLPGSWQAWVLMITSGAWCALYLDLCPSSYYLIKYTTERMRVFAKAVLHLPTHSGGLFVAPAHARNVMQWLGRIDAALGRGVVSSAHVNARCPDAIALFFCSCPHDTKFVRLANRDGNAQSLRRYVTRSKELQRRLRRTVALLESQETKARNLRKAQQASRRNLTRLRQTLQRRVGAEGLARIERTMSRPTRPASGREAFPRPTLESPTDAPRGEVAATAERPQPHAPPRRKEQVDAHGRARAPPRPLWQRRCRRTAANAWRRVRLLCFLVSCVVGLSLVCFGPVVCVMTLLADVVPHGALLLLVSIAICGTVGNAAIAYVASLFVACFPMFIMVLVLTHYASSLHGLVRVVTAEPDAVGLALEALHKTRRIVGPHGDHAAKLAQLSEERAARTAAQSPTRSPQLPPPSGPSTPPVPPAQPLPALPPGVGAVTQSASSLPPAVHVETAEDASPLDPHDTTTPAQ